MVCGDVRGVYEVYVLTVTCDAVDATAGCCAEFIIHVLTSLAYCRFVLCVSVGVSSMVTYHPLVMLCFSMTLRSYSASLMAASMSTSSLSLFAIIYVFILSIFFLWRLMAELIFNWLSVSVGLSD